LLRAIF